MNLKKILIVMFILSLSFNFYGKKKKNEYVRPKTPTNIQVIAQSAAGTKMSSYFYLTVIDLDNNEVVILFYRDYTLRYVERTGMFVDPKSQPAFKGTDDSGPFEDDE